jgi:hypothetical protein
VLIVAVKSFVMQSCDNQKFENSIQILRFRK